MNIIIKAISLIILGFFSLACMYAADQAPKGKKYPFYLWIAIFFLFSVAII